MLGANGGPTISPHNPLWCSFAIDPILSILHAGEAKNQGGRKSPAAVCEEIKKDNSSKGEPFGFTLLVLQTTIMAGQSCPDQ